MNHRKTRVRKASRKQKRTTRKRVQRGGVKVKNIPQKNIDKGMLLMEDGEGYKYHSVTVSKSANGKLIYTGNLCNYPGNTKRASVAEKDVLTTQDATTREQIEQWCY